MCKSTKTETVNKVPDYIEQGGKDVLARATAFADSPTTAFTPDQMTAFQQIRDMVANSPIVLPEALEGARTFRDAPAFELSAENARTNYFNPYTEAALEPAIRQIMEAADKSRQRIGSQAHMAGAFGDARQGVLEDELEGTTQQAIGDTSSRFFMDAFNQALDREAQRGQFYEQGLSRGLTGSGALLDFAGKDQGTMLQAIEALLGAGTIQQTDEDRQMMERINALIASIGGVPYTTTSTSTKPDNSGLGALGSIFGAALAPMTGGASLAIPMAGGIY